MSHQTVKLSDRFDLSKSPVLLNGTQALVRLMLIQSARDRAAGLRTAGYVTGYRGSPLGAVDFQMGRAQAELSAAAVTFREGLNEDLAATALWGTQAAELRGEGRFEGVFGLWYGKGPGVDRSGDVMKHVNMAGTSPHGGVLMAMGDDHTGESSTVLHQSEFAMVNAYMPILNPAGVQEILDYGVLGYALSRFSGLWVGLKTVKDTVEATAVVDGAFDRMSPRMPTFEMPEGGLNIRLIDDPASQEHRVVNYKKAAAEAFGYANKIDKRGWGKPGAKIGFVSTGKNWLDLAQAMASLGIDEREAERLGVTTYKVGMSWPLDMTGFMDWAQGLDVIVIVEEKRKLIEGQAKEALFHAHTRPRIFGSKDGRGQVLFPTHGVLDPAMIARKLGQILCDEGRETEGLRAALSRLEDAERANNASQLAVRTPYFCSGCPHNSSTKIPQGARGGAGIGCHYLVQFMERETTGFTHMGAEGANWIGEAEFSTRKHIFQNIGDGTYNHSGIQAIRAAVAAKTNITYKILFNDAVAMTGGQKNDGGLTAQQITHELKAMGIANVELVYDGKEEIDFTGFPPGLPRHERADLMRVQERMQTLPGVSALVYVQTCAAEKRRRRKRGSFPDIDKHLFINTDICEGCGDCGVQSNCVSIVPVETELGRKRAIDQSSCNKDFSCSAGFCPSFVTLKGAMTRKAAAAEFDLPVMPEPVLPVIDQTFNTVITGVGGTGVVTIGALLAMAAHLDGKGAAMIEMAGLSQKGGAVSIHLRVAKTPEDISAIRVPVGEADALIGGDLVVSASAKTLGLINRNRTGAVVNSHEIITGAFTRNSDFKLPTSGLSAALEARLGKRLTLLDASALAKALLGDSIYSNMMMCGAAWQAGLVPISRDAIRQALDLNGAAPARNKQAFEYGRWAVLYPDEMRQKSIPTTSIRPRQLDEKVAYRATHLRAYQSERLAHRYTNRVETFADPDLKLAVAEAYHKVLSYKDEYEVARLLKDTTKKAKSEFSGNFKVSYHLAPPLIPGKDPSGRPKKRVFGPWLASVLPVLAKMKSLRGTVFDPFGYSAERRAERELIVQYESDLDAVSQYLSAAAKADILELLRLPLSIRGFGPVKEQALAKAQARRDVLWTDIRKQSGTASIAAE